MKIKRHKKVQRYLSFYRNNFSFREPYQVLIDGTFCQSALTYKVNIRDQLPKYLDGEVKLLTTACVVIETEKFGPKLYGATLIVKQFGIHKCGHDKEPVGASQCLLSMLDNDNSKHYFLATQDHELREKVRNIPGTPIIYINYNAPILEKPSNFNEKFAAIQSEQRLAPSSFQEEMLTKLKKQEFGDEEMTKPRKRKRKGGPNPLSCKKKKKKPTPADQGPGNPKKLRSRHKKRVRLAHHVKEHFHANTPKAEPS